MWRDDQIAVVLFLLVADRAVKSRSASEEAMGELTQSPWLPWLSLIELTLSLA